ncbi:hypothetical protein [uncultured Desulfobacter sp.]|uniref:hypothetical protein n=1 Tax=uncultured Desulfobacter sp. TaxID=240139 RepID=UPI002AA626E4|nr:hypothetical protein [uncultured Desulfobacter sp.]
MTGAEKKSSTFNIIRSPKVKDYLYLFAFGCKSHPFCTAMIHTVPEDLDIELMKQDSRLFEGQHHFGADCAQRRSGSWEAQTQTLLSPSFFLADQYPKAH